MDILIAVATGEVTIIGDDELGIQRFGVKDALCTLYDKLSSRHAGSPLWLIVMYAPLHDTGSNGSTGVAQCVNFF